MNRVEQDMAYGCPSLMGHLSFGASARTLDVPYDVGIRHFDVARS